MRIEKSVIIGYPGARKDCRAGSWRKNMNKDDKLKALDAALTQIEKAYGKAPL